MYEKETRKDGKVFFLTVFSFMVLKLFTRYKTRELGIPI